MALGGAGALRAVPRGGAGGAGSGMIGGGGGGPGALAPPGPPPPHAGFSGLAPGFAVQQTTTRTVARFGCSGLTDESVLVSKMKSMAEEQYQRTHKAENENQQLQGRIQQLELCKEALEKKLSGQDAELAELHNSHVMLENQHAALRDLAATVQGLHEGLREDLGKAEEANIATNARQDNLSDKMKADLESWRMVRGQCEVAQAETRAAMETSVAAKAEADRVEQAGALAAIRLADLEGEQDFLKNQCAGLQEELATALKARGDLKAQLAICTGEKRAALDRESSRVKELQELEGTHAATLRKVEAAWEHKLSKAEVSAAAAEEARGKSYARLVEAEETCAELECKIKELEDKDKENSVKLLAAELQDRNQALEREKLNAEISALNQHADQSLNQAADLAKASEQANLELSDLKVRLSEMEAALKAKAEALENFARTAEVAQSEARAQAKRLEDLEAEKQEAVVAMQEARDDKEKFKSEINTQNNEALQNIEGTWKQKLAAKQAEVNEFLERSRALERDLRAEKEKARAEPAKHGRRAADAQLKRVEAKWAAKLKRESTKVSELEAALKRADGAPAPPSSPTLRFDDIDAQRRSYSISGLSQDCMDSAFGLDSGTLKVSATKAKEEAITNASLKKRGPTNRQNTSGSPERKKARSAPSTASKKKFLARRTRAGATVTTKSLGTRQQPLVSKVMVTSATKPSANHSKGAVKAVRFAPKASAPEASAPKPSPKVARKASHDVFGEGSLDPYAFDL